MSTRYFTYISLCVIKENYHLNIYPIDKNVSVKFPYSERIKQVKLKPIHEKDKSIPRGIEPS